jgi:DNA-binding GntR family transcriptional regulator
MRQIIPGPQIGESVYEAIRDAICDGALAPDERVVQDELAQRLGVSRQPVNQALQQLRKEGFLVEAGRRGLVVAPLDLDFARQVYELRAALDGAAAAAAAANARASDRAEGEQIIRAGRAAVADGDLAAMASADFEFHNFIYQLAGNSLIAVTARANWHHVRRSIMLLAKKPTKLGPFWDEHAAILGAVVSGDAVAAGQLARTHALASAKVISSRIKVPEPVEERG